MTSAYTIRPATAADIDVLVDFTLAEARDAERRTLDIEGARRGVRGAFGSPPRAAYWVAEAAGRVVGSTSVVTEWSNFLGGDYWWIQSLYVLPEHRGQGLVDQLLAHLAEQAQAAGALDLRPLRLQHQRARAARLPALRVHRVAVHPADQAAVPAAFGQPLIREPLVRGRTGRLSASSCTATRPSSQAQNENRAPHCICRASRAPVRCRNAGALMLPVPPVRVM